MTLNDMFQKHCTCCWCPMSSSMSWGHWMRSSGYWPGKWDISYLCWSSYLDLERFSYQEENLMGRNLHSCNLLTGKYWDKQLWSCRWMDQDIHCQNLSFVPKIFQNMKHWRVIFSSVCCAKEAYELASSLRTQTSSASFLFSCSVQEHRTVKGER